MNEIVFLIEEDPESGYVASALGASILTQGDDLDELRRNVRDAVECHFEDSDRPRIVRLHFVRDEVFALSPVRQSWLFPNLAVRNSEMTLQQTIVRDLATLDEAELDQVAQYLSFLKFRSRAKQQPQAVSQEWDPADDDRALVEANETVADIQQGRADYAAGLGQPLSAAFDDVRRQLGIQR